MLDTEFCDKSVHVLARFVAEKSVEHCERLYLEVIDVNQLIENVHAVLAARNTHGGIVCVLAAHSLDPIKKKLLHTRVVIQLVLNA